MKRSRSPYTGSERPSKKQKKLDLWVSKAPEVDLLDALEHHLHRMPRAQVESLARSLLSTGNIGSHQDLDKLDEEADEIYKEAQKINDILENHKLVIDLLLNSGRGVAKLYLADRSYHMCEIVGAHYKNDWNAIHFELLHMRRAKYHCYSCCGDKNNCECRSNLPPEVHPYIRYMRFSPAPRTLVFREVGTRDEHALDLDLGWPWRYCSRGSDTPWTWEYDDSLFIEAWLLKYVGGSASVWKIVLSYIPFE